MKPEDIRIGARYCTSREEYLNNPDRWEAIAEESLRNEIAYLLQKDRAEMTKTELMMEKRVDLYVAKPDVFWGIVKQEAEKIALRFMHK